jgi:hypothetical protein
MAFDQQDKDVLGQSKMGRSLNAVEMVHGNIDEGVEVLVVMGV